MGEHFAFTTTYQGITDRLLNDIVIYTNDQKIVVKAQWDTGANSSCISKEIALQLGLVPIGMAQIHTPAGTITVNRYLINITLPNNVNVENIIVNDSEIDSQGIGMLIGMDVIALGDFAISNYNGITVCSFRIPSQAQTDYVQQLINNSDSTHGPNTD